MKDRRFTMKELPKIMTIDAMNLFMFCKKNAKDGYNSFCFDETDSRINHLVIKQIAEFDECPLLHQIIKIDRARKKVKEEKKDVFKNKTWLLDKLIIVDFGYIFNSFDQDSEHDNTIMKNNAKDLMENGLDIIFSNNKVHMIPFDKSGNMSRNSRITFVNSDYYDELNERLNLGMDFTGINVVLSKYYAYRGLYLSSSKRVDDKELKITPETLVIIKDKRKNA